MTEGKPPGPPAGTDGPPPDGMGQGWASLGTLLSGMLVWGGVGWLLDRVLGTTFCVPVGVLVGLASAVYLVYVRSGPPT